MSVKDTGKGMTDEEKRKVFQAFTRLKSAQGIEGTGLGLSITQELVSLLGGEILLRSTLGKGSNFIVTLPIEPAPKMIRRRISNKHLIIKRRELSQPKESSTRICKP